MAPIPPLSVAMPVHNALPHLDESVASILGQSFGDFELVILDDGSTDGSEDALKAWAERDSRIRLFASARRLGPVGSSNFVAGKARAPLVARMDADDICHPERLRRQVDLFASAPDAVLLGTLSDLVDDSGRPLRPADFARVARPTPFKPFPHSSIMFRKSAFDRAGGYRAAAHKWEDVDLSLRLAEIGRVLVILEPLVTARVSEVSTRLRDDPGELERAMDLMCRCLETYVETGGYERCIATPAAGKLHPRAFVACGSLRLWAGRPPRIFGRVRRRARLGWNSASAKLLVWAVWADLSPKSLRAVLRGILRLRNRSARRRLGIAAAVEWRPAGKTG